MSRSWDLNMDTLTDRLTFSGHISTWGWELQLQETWKISTSERNSKHLNTEKTEKEHYTSAIPSHIWQNSSLFNEMVSICYIYASNCNCSIILNMCIKVQDFAKTPSYIGQNSLIINEMVSICHIYTSNSNRGIILNMYT